MKNQQVLILSLVLLIAVLLGARAHAETRFDVIKQLQNWQHRTSQRKDLIEREKDLRLHFINRLIFQVERKYQEGSSQNFWQSTLADMTKTDQLQINKSFGAMPEFLENLSLSLKSLLEQNEKPLHLIQTFTEYSGISDPATAEEFSETRSYYNGRRTLGANPLTVEQATAHLEEYEKSLEELKQKEANPFEGEWIDFREDIRQDFIPQHLNEPFASCTNHLNKLKT